MKYTLQEEKDFQIKVITRAHKEDDLTSEEVTTYTAQVEAYTNIGEARINFLDVICVAAGNGWTDSQGLPVRYRISVTSDMANCAVDAVVDNDGWLGTVLELFPYVYTAQNEADGLGVQGELSGTGCMVVAANYPCVVNEPTDSASTTVGGVAIPVGLITCEW
jgi:hypothetical protein